jgi:translocation and assembly module TamA
VVRNLNQIHAGDYYSEAALQSYQSRLQDTGYFASVEVSADMSAILSEQLDAAAMTPEQNAAAPMAPLPLLVRVVENKRKNVSAGLGYSTNTGNRASLTYDDLSVFGLRMKSALTLETKKQTATSNFYFPVTPEGYNDSVGASFERSDISGEVTSVASIAGKRAWGTPLLERSLTLELLTETKTIGGIPSSQSKSLPLTYGVTWRKLDNLLFPTKGYALNAQVGGALLPILTDEAFVRGYARGVTYLPLGVSTNAIFRAELGALTSRDKNGVPAVYLFRAGGDQSVRGYGYQELGVARTAPSPAAAIWPRPAPSISTGSSRSMARPYSTMRVTLAIRSAPCIRNRAMASARAGRAPSDRSTSTSRMATQFVNIVCTSRWDSPSDD